MKAFDLPFDEAFDSKVAQDFSGNGHNAYLGSDFFTTGRVGNALYTFPFSATVMEDNPLNFAGDFTVYQWMLSDVIAGYPHEIVAYVTFAELENELLILNANSNAANWTMFTLSKSGNTIRLFRDVTQQDSFVIPGSYGNITGVYFIKRYTGAKPSNSEAIGVYLDELVGINGQAFGPPDISELITNQNSKVSYYINGVNLREIGVEVQEATGLFDTPETKDTVQSDWADMHGLIVDRKAVRYNARNIELTCWIVGNNKEEVIDKVMTLKDLVSGNGLIRFMFKVGIRPYTFDVFVKDTLAFEIKKFVDRQSDADFTLSLVEPMPVKKVFKFVANSANNRTVNFQMNTNKENLSIFWGDENVTHNVRGAAINQSHTFTADGEYYINISGVVENITSLSHNAVLIWNRLY